MEDHMKEVYFNEYCPKCRYADKQEAEDPCYDCLTEPAMQYSHKPAQFVDSGKNIQDNAKVSKYI